MLWRRLSLKTLAWVVSGIEGLFRTQSRALVTHALLEALLAGCRVTAAAHALAVPRIALEHAALVASLHERLRSNLGACPLLPSAWRPSASGSRRAIRSLLCTQLIAADRSFLGASVCERLCVLLHASVERSNTDTTEHFDGKSAANLLQVLVSLYLLKVCICHCLHLVYFYFQIYFTCSTHRCRILF